MTHFRRRALISLFALTLPSIFAGALLGCGGTVQQPPSGERIEGQTEFLSVAPGGRGLGSFGGRGEDGASPSSDAGTTSPSPAPGGGKVGTVERKVEETDLYRVEGDRLYYLNSYRGLMVFDVSDVDHPKLLGRSPIFGQPVEMLVRKGMAYIVVADWYGKTTEDKPFHGSIVRGIDARDPSNMKMLGDALLGGWVRDTRVVGDVLYAVSEDYGWSYGYDEATASGDGVSSSTGSKVIVSSVSFSGGVVKQAGLKEFPGYGGIFNVTSSSIMLARDVVKDPKVPWSEPTGRTELQYIDISDPLGTIKLRGAIEVNGRAQGWGADNGRWNLDFADGTWAHILGCAGPYCGSDAGYVLTTAEFTDPDHPKPASELKIDGKGWMPAARFSDGRAYVSPANDYWYGSGTPKTPVQIYDLKDPKAPKFAGQTEITGNVWLFMPSGDRLFALGNEPTTTGTPYYYGSKISLRYLDVADAALPKVIGTSTFGEGWAWTPAAGTFKAFTKDDKQGLVVLPFSGWSAKDNSYNNGLQLIEFSRDSIKTAGTAKTRGWVERGIFVKNRLVSLSDMALSVVDYSDKSKPKITAELTLARNVVDARPQGATIAEVSSDWWDNDLSSSELRILALKDAEEMNGNAISETKIDGHNARVFHNGTLAYIVTNLRKEVTCPTGGGGGRGEPMPAGGDGSYVPHCYSWTQAVTVVDTKDGKATVRGKIALPEIADGYYGYWGWYGCYWYDWFDGDSVVQVGKDALAFRRWVPIYSPGTGYDSSKQSLFIVNLKDADKPTVASTVVTTDYRGWWGNMRAVGDTLYTTHYDWLEVDDSVDPSKRVYYVKYYLDRVDLSDRSAPKIGARINVPGVLVGGSEKDPSLLYFVDYRWYSEHPGNELSVGKLSGDKVYLQGSTTIDGWVGNVFIQSDKAYMSAERYYWRDAGTYRGPRVQLHEVDLATPTKPVDRVSTEKRGWGWLLGVTGDRAIVTSGWGSGIDIYRVGAGKIPSFDQYVRTRGWWTSSLARQDDSLYLSSGYWGVQKVDLKK